MRIKNGLIYITVGIALFGYSIFQTKMDEIKMQRMDASTYSVSTSYNVHRSDDRNMYTPKYTYIVDGQKYVCTSRYSSSSKPSYLESRKIFYNSQNPSDCFPEYGQSETYSSWSFLIIPIVFIIIGIGSFFGITPKKYISEDTPLKKKTLKKEWLE